MSKKNNSFALVGEESSETDKQTETAQDEVDGVLSQSTFLSSYNNRPQAQIQSEGRRPPTDCNLPPDLLAFASDFDVFEKPLPNSVEKIELINQTKKNYSYFHVADIQPEEVKNSIVQGTTTNKRKRASKEISVKVNHGESALRTHLCPSCSSVVTPEGFVQNDSMSSLVQDLYRVC
eukprot:GHVP01022289.1.p1 GENE.GHVP01022289.1~~GHVP01022289.1.p1  ORF type:complete len:177 (+),score=37.15 GHVP01022289.1:471-1001(+)